MNLTAWPGRGFLPDVGEAVATYWEKVGIKVKRRPVDRAVFAADFRARAYPGVALAYAAPLVAPEPWEVMIRARLHEGRARTCSSSIPKLDEFIDRLAVQPNYTERVRIMRDEMGPWLQEYVPGVAIGAAHAIAGVGPKVGDWPMIPGHMGFHNWEYVSRSPLACGRYLIGRVLQTRAEHARRDQHRLRPDAPVGQSRPPAARRQRERARPADPDAAPRPRPAAARPVRHLRQEHLRWATSAARSSRDGPSPSTSGSGCPPPSSSGFVAMFLSVLIGVPLGMYSAVHRGGTLDSGARVFAVLGQSMPAFWLGLMLILLFGVVLRRLAGRRPRRHRST